MCIENGANVFLLPCEVPGLRVTQQTVGEGSLERVIAIACGAYHSMVVTGMCMAFPTPRLIISLHTSQWKLIERFV